MKIAIIGAGNMGGSIARGLAKGTIIPASDIIVSNPTQNKLDKLKAEFPALQVTNDNQEVSDRCGYDNLCREAMADETCSKGIETERHTDSYLRCSRYSLRRLTHYAADKEMTMFRLIPNTAISEMESMTLIASRNATKEQEQLMLDIFNQMGLCHAHSRGKDCGNHRHDFLRHRLCAEVHPGSYAGRH